MISKLFSVLRACYSRLIEAQRKRLQVDWSKGDAFCASLDRALCKSNQLVHADFTQVIELAANSKSTSVDKRAIILSMLIMALAGDFVGKTLSWDKQKALSERHASICATPIST
jgi:hypothetical protein